MTKIHLIEDESIGGVKREYTEADREAEVGDKIVIVDAYFSGESYQTGDILTVTATCKGGSVRCKEIANHTNFGGLVDRREYRVLTPAESTPDIYDLMANLVTRVAGLEAENKRIKQDLGWHETGPGRIANLRNSVSDLKHGLAQLEVNFEQEKHESDEFADEVMRKVGELVRAKGSVDNKFASIESQLRDTQNNVQTFAEQTESNTKDIAFLDERTYEKPVKPSKSAEEILREISKILERDNNR